MNDVSKYFLHSQIAQAAYGALDPDVDPIPALTGGSVGIPLTQAELFVDHWRVIEQYDHYTEETHVDEFGQEHVFRNPSGMSVTLFEEVATGQRFVAIRGTDDASDVWTDLVDIAFFGTPERQAQYEGLRDKIQQWLDTGELEPGFTVTGHSLGGFLAGALLVDFPAEIGHAYLYNTPGVGGLPAALRLLLGAEAAPHLDLSKVSNLIAQAGPSVVAGLGVDWGEVVPVFIEDQGLDLLGNHALKHLVDALAVHDLFARIDSSLPFDTIREILGAVSNQPELTLESALSSIGKLFGQDSFVMSGDRDALYQGLADLRTALPGDGGFSVESLVGLGAGEIAAAARADVAYRYALKELNPFVIRGGADLYAQHNAAGELEIGSSQGGSGELTASFISDRAAMLAWKMKFDTGMEDANDLLVFGNRGAKPYTEDWDTAEVTGDWVYVDHSARSQGGRLALFIDGSGPLLSADPDHHIEFGSDGSERLEGESAADRLYGAGGDDVLVGHGGDDYLEGGRGDDTLEGGQGLADVLSGGVGNDTYVFRCGDQAATIRDADGKGRVAFIDENGVFRYAGETPVRRMEGSDNTYIDDYGFRYQHLNDYPLLGPGELMVFAPDGGVIRVENFVDGALGIDLQEPAAVLPGSGTTFHLDERPGENQVISDGRTVIAEVYGSPSSDIATLKHVIDNDLAISHSGIRIYGAAGDDNIAVGYHDAGRYASGDWQIPSGRTTGAFVDAGDGDDYVAGSLFDDSILGGDGHDTLNDAGGNDCLSGGVGNDFLDGDSSASELGFTGHGDDVADGGAGTDFLYGGGGADQLIGGDGADCLFGDTVGGYAVWDGAQARLIPRDLGDENLPHMYLSYDVDLDHAGSDLLDGGFGDDYLYGGAGTDTLLGGAGNDVLQGEAGDDLLRGGDNDDWIWGDKSPQSYSDDTTKVLFESGPGRYFFRQHRDGDDVAGDDYLYGGAGNDGLDGGAGDDLLSGGRHDDILLGGAGNDRFLFGYGDGHDQVVDDSGNSDRVVFGDGIAAADLAYRDDGADLHIYVTSGGLATSDVVTLVGQGGLAARADDIVPRAEQSSSEGIEQLQFSDGRSIDTARVPGALTPFFGAGTIALSGDTANTAFSFAANQFVDDFDIVVSDTGGDDAFAIERFFLEVPAQVGLSALSVGAEAERVTREGSDLVVEMTIRSNIGGYFNQGASGSLRVENYFKEAGRIESVVIGNREFVPEAVLQTVAEPVAPRTYVRPFSPLLPEGVYEAYDPDGAYGYAPESVAVVGTDGDDVMTIGVPAQAHGARHIQGHGGDDVLTGTEYRDVLDGGEGGDRLEAGLDYDTYVIGPNDADVVFDDERGSTSVSSDTVVIPEGVSLGDLRFSREGDDLLINSSRIERYFERDDAHGGYDPYPYKVEHLQGDGWSVRLDDHVSHLFAEIRGTEENETLHGDERDNVFVVDLGNNGVDEIIDAAASTQDVLRLNANLADVGFDWVQSDAAGREGIVLTSLVYPDATVTVRLAGPYDESAFGIERFEFLDSTLDRSEVLGLLPPRSLTVLEGDQGDNELIGDVAPEILVGKTGDDLMIGQAGGDVYLYNHGDSAGAGDVIDDMAIDGISVGADTLSLGGGILPDVVTASLHYDVYGDEYAILLQLGFSDGGAGIEIIWEFGLFEGDGTVVEPSNIEQIQFVSADGWSLYDLAAVVESRHDALVAAGSAGESVALFTPDLLRSARLSQAAAPVGGAYALDYALAGDPGSSPATPEFNDIVGTDGRDRLMGSDRNDRIIGGAGRDRMQGLAGDDVFVVEGLDTAYDVFNGGDGFDTVSGGVLDDTVRVRRFAGDNTVERIDGGEGVNVIAGTSDNNRIDLSGTEIMNIALIDSGEGDDRIEGSNGDDVIDGGPGSDRLRGGPGDDVFLVSGTDAAYDVFNGGEGWDQILGGPGDDVIRLKAFSGERTVEAIDGGGGYNTIAGTDESDRINLGNTSVTRIALIDGLGGEDVIRGSADNDVIRGGTGNDILKGGQGDDLYLFARGDGQDSITDRQGTANTDTLRFDAGVDADQLWFSRTGDDLEISVIGSADSVKVANWFRGARHQIERIEAGAGEVLLSTQVSNLVNAMAAFSPPDAGQTVLPEAYEQELAPVIAASWQ